MGSIPVGATLNSFLRANKLIISSFCFNFSWSSADFELKASSGLLYCIDNKRIEKTERFNSP